MYGLIMPEVFKLAQAMTGTAVRWNPECFICPFAPSSEHSYEATAHCTSQSLHLNHLQGRDMGRSLEKIQLLHFEAFFFWLKHLTWN